MTTHLQELQAEVRRRQAAVLRPEPGTEEEGLNAFQRQKRLRFSPPLRLHCVLHSCSASQQWHDGDVVMCQIVSTHKQQMLSEAAPCVK